MIRANSNKSLTQNTSGVLDRYSEFDLGFAPTLPTDLGDSYFEDIDTFTIPAVQ